MCARKASHDYEHDSARASESAPAIETPQTPPAENPAIETPKKRTIAEILQGFTPFLEPIAAAIAETQIPTSRIANVRLNKANVTIECANGQVITLPRPKPQPATASETVKA